jgi:hypothetical protein
MRARGGGSSPRGNFLDDGSIPSVCLSLSLSSWKLVAHNSTLLTLRSPLGELERSGTAFRIRVAVGSRLCCNIGHHVAVTLGSQSSTKIAV